MISILEQTIKYKVVYEDKFYFVTIYKKNNEEAILIQDKNNNEVDNNTYSLIENYFNLVTNE